MNVVEIPDLTIIGRTAPEYSQRHRSMTVCMGAWSPTFRQWFRVYPLPRDQRAPKRWSTWKARLRPAPNDFRASSWEIAGDFEEAMTATGKTTRERWLNQMEHFCIESLEAMNKCRQSMGLLRVKVTNLHLDYRRETQRQDAMAAWQATAMLFEDGLHPNIRPSRPRVQFTDESGCEHDLIDCEWGAEVLAGRLGGEDPVPAWRAKSMVDNPEYEHFAAVGNIITAPSQWIIGSLLCRKRGGETPLLDELEQLDLEC